VVPQRDLAAIPGIRQAQILQGELSRLQANIQPGLGYGEATIRDFQGRDGPGAT